MVGSDLVLRGPEAELLGPPLRLQPAASQQQESGGSANDDAHRPKVGQGPEHQSRPGGHDTPGRNWADSRHPDQFAIRCRGDFHREVLGMIERPGRLRILRQGKISGGAEDHLLGTKAITLHQVGGLVEPVLAKRRRGRSTLQRRVADWAEGTEMGVMDSSACLESADGVKQGLVGVGGGSDHELHGHAAATPRVQRILRLPL
jgi:hypothetical protein